MGDGADMIDMFMECCECDAQDYIDDNAREGFWENNKGDMIYFKGISPEYALNIKNWCDKNEIEAPTEILSIIKQQD